MRRMRKKQQSEAEPEGGGRDGQKNELPILVIVGILLLSLVCLAGAWALLR